MYFITGAFVAFNIVGSKDAGWAILAAGLSGPLAALIWHAARRERPDSFIIVPLGALVLFTLLFGLNEGFPGA
ncbi:hypothetical protein [Streptomyces wuyuanensis]|uniref:hypothetical protein n=1 Tax=Streptomyces wuyuanensis TaxID=1196353 RepID=UPI003D738CF5